MTKILALIGLLLLPLAASAQATCYFFCPAPPGFQRIAPFDPTAWEHGLDMPGLIHKDAGGVVRLEGVLVKNGRPSYDVVFFLPYGYRPARNQWFTVAMGAIGESPVGTAMVLVQSNGYVWIISEPGTWVSLSGISFIAAP